MAGVRVGLAFASVENIDLMNRVKPPYNVSGIAQQAVIDSLECRATVSQWLNSTKFERSRLESSLKGLGIVKTVYPSNANFLLVKVTDANAIHTYLIDEKIVVRNRNNVELCEGCLRITVGTSEENERLVLALTTFCRDSKYSPQLTANS